MAFEIRLPGEPFGIACPGFVPAIESDDAPDRLQIIGHFLDQRIEIGADEQNIGAGIVDHIGDLWRRKPEIDRHQHDVGLGGAEPQIEEGRRILR